MDLRSGVVLLLVAAVAACTTADSSPPDSCFGSAKTTCLAASAGICDPTKPAQPTCAAGSWSCPAGTLPSEQCRCGASPSDDCIADGGTDAPPDAIVLLDVEPSDTSPPTDVSETSDVAPPRDIKVDSTVETCGDAARYLCFRQTPEGLCNDVIFVSAYCSSNQWACPPGYLPPSQCRCGVPPRGDCLKDSGSDGFIVDNLTPICGDGAAVRPYCLRQLADGTCDEGAGSVSPLCIDDQYVCPSGSVSYDQCLCGTPPTNGCIDGGLGVDAND